jgi:hypothetical protein
VGGGVRGRDGRKAQTGSASNNFLQVDRFLPTPIRFLDICSISEIKLYIATFDIGLIKSHLVLFCTCLVARHAMPKMNTAWGLAGI